jgi:hypothetical protein
MSFNHIRIIKPTPIRPAMLSVSTDGTTRQYGLENAGYDHRSWAPLWLSSSTTLGVNSLPPLYYVPPPVSNSTREVQSKMNFNTNDKNPVAGPSTISRSVVQNGFNAPKTHQFHHTGLEADDIDNHPQRSYPLISTNYVDAIIKDKDLFLPQQAPQAIISASKVPNFDFETAFASSANTLSLDEVIRHETGQETNTSQVSTSMNGDEDRESLPILVRLLVTIVSLPLCSQAHHLLNTYRTRPFVNEMLMENLPTTFSGPMWLVWH